MSKSEGATGSKARWRRRSNAPPLETPAEVRSYVEAHVTPARDNVDRHRYLDPEAWNFPSAARGGREVVFEALVGRISRKSILVNKCGDRECVSPDHCEVDNREDYAAKLAGTFDPMIIAPDGRPIRKSQFEKTLSVYPWRVTALDKLGPEDERGKRRNDARDANGKFAPRTPHDERRLSIVPSSGS